LNKVPQLLVAFEVVQALRPIRGRSMKLPSLACTSEANGVTPSEIEVPNEYRIVVSPFGVTLKTVPQLPPSCGIWKQWLALPSR
jgi:hypothetical protein